MVGKGVERNIELALHWLQEAVVEGDPQVQYLLGRVFMDADDPSVVVGERIFMDVQIHRSSSILNIHRYSWTFIDIRRYSWILMDIHRYSWMCTDIQMHSQMFTYS